MVAGVAVLRAIFRYGCACGPFLGFWRGELFYTALIFGGLGT